MLNPSEPVFVTSATARPEVAFFKVRGTQNVATILGAKREAYLQPTTLNGRETTERLHPHVCVSEI